MSSASPGNEYVSDTMALVLWVEKRKLSPAVKAVFQDVEQGKATVYVPAMVSAEILYLFEKGRISVSPTSLASYLGQHSNFRECSMNLAVVLATAEIKDISDLHDRLIAGTARFLNRPLLTNDPVIRASTFLTTTW